VNILCDYHHSDLWWSHHLIFERALGHTLFRPRGIEWFESGYYQFSSRAVAEQFLVNSLFTIDQILGYPTCRIPRPAAVPADLRAGMDTLNGCAYYPLIRTLSFEEFKDAPIDVIMPTISDMQEPWLRLRNDFKPGAKLLREEGNVNGWVALHPAYGNLLTSDVPTFQKSGATNKFLYHQRFDTESVFVYRKPTAFDLVSCFMPGFRGEPRLVSFAESHDFGRMRFVDYGHHSPLGFLSTKERFVEAMNASALVWHVKPGGDGFGHVIHNAVALGRPVVTFARDYRGTIAEPLLEDYKTCLFIGDDPVENSRKIRRFADRASILEMSKRARIRFRNIVDYDEEARGIAALLGRLV
jgi:hypothetical protein